MTARELVQLDQDHPGFRDRAYRERRDAIARIALDHRREAPVPDVHYVAEEHEVWRTVWTHLDPLHTRYACRAYLDGARAVSLPRERIPQLAGVNATLQRVALASRRPAFSMLPVAGLVTPRLFMEELADGVFLATQYVRHWSRPLYTPEPDVIHELVGHAPTLVEPSFMAINRAFGRATRRANDERTIQGLIRLYWYAVEFGVVEEGGKLKVCGAGLLSSFGELGRFETQANLVPFDVARIVETSFDPTSYQSSLFVAPSFEHMAAELFGFLGNDGQPDAESRSAGPA